MLTADALTKLETIQPADLARLSDQELLAFTKQLMDLQAHDRQVNQLRYYKPVSPRALGIHLSTATTIGVGGGNGSSKTDSSLVEGMIRCTGQIPLSLKECYPRQKLRGPINCRIVVESLTTTLFPIILPKLDYRKWQGVDQAGGPRGHWGWIPQDCLIDGQWDKSWKAHERILRLYYRDPDDRDVVVGESTIQFMCVRGDQRVLTESGTWIEIAALKDGDRIASRKGVTTITRTFHYENAPVFRIRCRGGREIVATPNHQHYLKDGRILRTDQLQVGDVLMTIPVDTLPMQRSTVDPHWPLWKLGWLGIILGDGCTRRRDVGFTAMPGSRVLADLPPLPPNTRLVQMGDPKEFRLWLTKGRRDNPLVSYLKSAHIWGLTSQDKFVPTEVFRQPPEAIAYFLKHLWNCDGSVNGAGRQAMYVTISKRLAYDVKYLLWGLGIYAGVTDGVYPCGFTGKMIHRYTVQVSGGSFDRFNAALAGYPFTDIKIQMKGEHGTIKEISYAGCEEVYCVAVDSPDHAFIVDGLVTHNSYDQDPSDFASGDFHLVLHDEPPKEAIWVENMARTMRVDGTMMLAMTWPDDPTISVDWMLDRIYEPAQPGAKRDPNIEWINLVTTENRNLNQTAIARTAGQMSIAERSARIYGQPIRLSNRVHPLFTEDPHTWCFACHDLAILDELGQCGRCQSKDVTSFSHVHPVRANASYPVVQVLDPHPRKPHMLIWVQVTPSDDLEQIDEMEVSDVPAVVWDRVQELESGYGFSQVYRLMDPNMGGSPSGTEREVSWQEAFDRVGMRIDLADDGEVGRRLFNDYLKPDASTREPRYRVDPRCIRTIYQLKRYAWDDHKRTVEKDQKQRAKQKHDDNPTMLKYLMNSNPSFRTLKHMGAPYARTGQRHHGY